MLDILLFQAKVKMRRQTAPVVLRGRQLLVLKTDVLGCDGVNVSATHPPVVLFEQMIEK